MRGGLNISPVRDDEFKYTQSKQRITWNKYTFPIGSHLIQAVQSIPWKSYAFEGNVHLRFDKSINTTSFNPDYKNTAQWTYTPEPVKASTADFLHYHYFGGCVYEILQSVYPPNKGYPILRKYVDPTGDVDVVVFPPEITLVSNYDDDVSDCMYIEDVSGKRMNELIDDYTQWLFQQLYAQLKKIPERIWGMLFAEAEPFSFRDNAEGSDADLSEAVGNLWLVRTPQLDRGMVKIQLIAKFPTLESDHILELVLPISVGGDVIKSLKHRWTAQVDLLFDTLPISSMTELLSGNMEAIQGRLGFWDQPDLRHKLYNHVGRLQYMNNLMPALLYHPSNPDIQQGTLRYSNDKFNVFSSVVQKFAKTVLQWKRTGDLRYLVYTGEYDPQEVIQGLLGNVVEYIFTSEWRYGMRKLVSGLSHYRILPDNKTYSVYEIVEELFPSMRIREKKGGRRKTRRVKRKTCKTRTRRS